MVAAKALGPLLIAAAAILLATDAPFRVPALQPIQPTWLVFAAHLVGVLVLAVWVLVARRKDVFALRPIEFAGIVLIGSGGSADGMGLSHMGSDRGYWQGSVAELLARRAGIRLTEGDWTPR